MTSKLPSEKIITKIINHVPKLFSSPKSSRKKPSVTFLKHFLNIMIRNIKIHNIFGVFEISKSMEPNKCIKK
jgi:hypothetical protein